jgi:hypothetical protein
MRPASGLLLAAVLLAAALAAGERGKPSQRTDPPDIDLERREPAPRGERVLWLRPGADAESIEVETTARVRAGTFAFELYDDAGQLVFDVLGSRGTLRGSSGRVSCAGDRCDGEWKLVARLAGSGEWRLRAWGVVEVSEPAEKPGR